MNLWLSDLHCFTRLMCLNERLESLASADIDTFQYYGVLVGK